MQRKGIDTMFTRSRIKIVALFVCGALVGWLLSSLRLADNIVAQDKQGLPTERGGSPFLPVEYPARYMGADAKLVTAPNGACPAGSG
jgi:hypothetical protein